MFDSFKKKTVEDLLEEVRHRKTEEQLLANVVKEIEAGVRRDGLWAKALVSAKGDETKAKVEYIQLRVQSILDDEMLEAIRKAEKEQQTAEDLRKEKEAKAEEQRLAKDFWNVASLKMMKEKFTRAGLKLEETQEGYRVTYPNGQTRETIWRSGLSKLFDVGASQTE